MGGVVTTTANVKQELCDILGISLADFERFCGKGPDDLLSLLSDGVIGTREFWRIFSAKSGIAVKTDWWHFLFHPELNEKTVALVRELKKAGHRVVCGTNTIESFYLNHIERGDYSYFDQTYASCFMGVSKPDPEFWKVILKAEGVSALDTVFIDDKQENCRAASSLGIKSIVFTDFDSVKKEVEKAVLSRTHVVGEYIETTVRT